MYHRYMPMENGQYRRQAVQETESRASRPQPPARKPPSHTAPKPQNHAQHNPTPVPKPPSPPVKPPPKPCSPPDPKPPQRPPEHKLPCTDQRPRLPFLDKLLPNMDSGDLLLVLVLLLLIAEGNADSEPMIMTLLICLLL